MKLYPAIDIKNGECVRLKQGKFHDVSVYSESPVKMAKLWEDQGASYIHVVDLDGALQGESANGKAIEEIVKGVNIPIQVGGGIRTLEDIEYKLSLGVDRVIIGTQAVKNPDFVKEAIEKFGPEKIVVGIDAKEGRVAIEAWEKTSEKQAVELALTMKEFGVKTIIYTDIAKDGMLQGPNVLHTQDMIEKTGLDIIASGGVTTIKDLEKLKEIKSYGAIIGKALYEDRIELKEAVELFEK